jgi:hypothetical protein
MGLDDGGAGRVEVVDPVLVETGFECFEAGGRSVVWARWKEKRRSLNKMNKICGEMNKMGIVG